jgi:hypothetical protein
VTAPRGLVDLLSNEDGDTWWVTGHAVPDDVLRLSLAWQLTVDMAMYAEDPQPFEDAAAAVIDRGWWRPVPGDDDEAVARCQRGDDGAEPFTHLALR